jgi:hypothetical protein
MQLLDLAERYFGIANSETDEVHSYGDLPESMKDWLRTGDASFSGDPITDHDGLALAYQEAFHPDEIRDDSKHDLARMTLSLFCRHKIPFRENDEIRLHCRVRGSPQNYGSCQVLWVLKKASC